MSSTARSTLSSKRISQKSLAENNSEDDHIIRLPNQVLLHIFYFLPLECWLTMSLVSKRFVDLWTHIPFLDFDQHEMEDKIMRNSSCLKNGKCRHSYFPIMYHPKCAKFTKMKFVRVVDRMIRLHSGSTLNSFNLSINYYQQYWDVKMVDSWVHFAMTRNIKQVELNFNQSYPTEERNKLRLYTVPSEHFASKALTKLALEACKFKASSLGTFENLSFFGLTSVTLLDKTVGHFLSKFPRLSELCMYDCVLEDNFFVTNEEVKVKILSLSDCMTTKSMVFPIYITAPNLMKYHFSGSCLDSCSIMGAHKLKDANIYIDGPVAGQSQESLLDTLLKDLSHCQTLYLNSWCIQVLATRKCSGSNPLHQLQNTKELYLALYSIKQELPGICFIPDVFEFQVESYWKSQDISFECMQYSLKTIKVEAFTGQAMEMQTLKFLLENAMVLEKLDLCDTDSLHETDMVKSFKKASPDARIAIINEFDG
ncbi:putative F-box/LRR-repeat protein [Tanacetum coccineum]